MRTIDELKNNSQVQITENVKSCIGDVHGVMVDCRNCRLASNRLRYKEKFEDENGEVR